MRIVHREMFDDLTFALRYESVLKISLFGMVREIPLPVTQHTVDDLERCGWWPSLEPIFGPYVAPQQWAWSHLRPNTGPLLQAAGMAPFVRELSPCL
jgi:hypothetical protein